MIYQPRKTVQDFIHALGKHWAYVFVLAATGFVLACCGSLLFIQPEYESQVQMVAQESAEETAASKDQGQNTDWVKTYANVIKTPAILEDVVNKHPEAGLTADALNNRTEVDGEKNSKVFTVSVRDHSPYQAAKLANAVGNSFQAKAPEILGISQVSLLTAAKPNEKPSYPKPFRNGIIGAVVGLVLGLIIEWIRFYRDDKVRSLSIVKDMGWKLIGVLPEMSSQEIAETRWKKSQSSDRDQTIRRRV